MEFVRWLVVSLPDLHDKEAWFSDNQNYCSYNEHYALSINIHHSLRLVFSCDDIILKKKIDTQLKRIFQR